MITLSLGAVLGLSAQLRGELRQLQEEPVDSLHWNVTQLELDVVQLEAEMKLALAAPGANLTSLRRRFDLFYSRAGTVIDGSMFSRLGLVETVAPTKARMREFLTETARLIDGDDPTLRAALPDRLTTVAALRQDLRTMAIQVIDVNAAIQDAHRARLGDILQQVVLASVALIALLLGLLALVLGANRRADRRTREVQRITSRLEATVATSLDAVIVAGMDGRVIDYNAAAETIFGYSRTEAVGQPLSALIVPARHKAAHDAGMERMKTSGVKHVVDAGRIQITAVRKSGEEFPVELAIASNDGPDGMIFIAYVRDISDVQRAEAALVAARDKAQAAEQTKTNFIAVMSHEMRTPLNGVIGALDILGRTSMQPQQDKFLALARSSAQQLLRHVNDVLDISRVDAGQLGVQDDRFDLPALLATLIDPMRPAAAQKAIRIEVRMLSALPTLRGDGFRIGQIVQNFVSNAIKFTEKGSITVEAELQRMLDGRAEVELRVIDAGIGIAEADQDRIFDAFVMVDPSHGRSVGGTGLGLAISRRLARAMGGEVGVESTPGEGTCFWLRLPLALDHPGDPRPDPAPDRVVPNILHAAPGSQSVRVDRNTPTDGRSPQPLDILVVEDNETNRIVLDEMLRHLGHRVTLAADGREGVEKAHDTRFDVVLMDLSMPLMDGWAAASAIRLGGASQHSCILAVTAHARPDRMDRMAEAGIDGWLTKPLSARTLTEALAQRPERPDGSDSHGLISRTEPGLIDAERLQELKQIANAEGLHRLLATFFAQMESIGSALERDADIAPLEDIAAYCHSGAGAAAVLGAEAMHRCLADLEAACNAGDRAAVQFGRRSLAKIWPATRDGLVELVA